MGKIIWIIVGITALLWIWTFLGFYIWSDIPLGDLLRVFSFDRSTLSFAIWILFLLGIKDVMDASRETALQKEETLRIKSLVEASLGANPGLGEVPALKGIRQQSTSLYNSIKSSESWFSEHLQKLLEIAHKQRTHVGQEPFITLLSQKIHVSDHKTYYIVALGVLGTIVGILISLRGFSENIAATDVVGFDHIKSLLYHSLAGLNTAFYTTLFGLLLGGFTLHALIRRANIQRESILILIQETTESLVIPALNSWEGLSDDVVTRIAADYCEASENITSALNKLLYAEALQELHNVLKALQIPMNNIKTDIQAISEEIEGFSGVAKELAKQMDERNKMVTQIAEALVKS